MDQVIGDLVPVALAVALSPVPIIAVVLMLATPRARTDGPAFAVGWVLGLTVVSVLVLVVAGGADDPDSASSTGADVLTLLLGLAFLVMALKQWRGRPQAGTEPVMPKWMATIDQLEPGKAFVLGVLLSAANPKNLALTLAAAASIAQAGLETADEAIAVAVFVLLGSVTVVGAVVAYLVGGERVAGPLASVKEFMTEHNVAIMVVILLILGGKLVGNGLSGLAA